MNIYQIKENLIALYNDTYHDIIKHNVRNSIPIIHEDIVKNAIFTIWLNLFWRIIIVEMKKFAVKTVFVEIRAKYVNVLI